MAVSFWFLSQALKSIPIGTGYAVWTGIGAIGVATVGLVLFAESASTARPACIGLIVAGVAGLKVVSPQGWSWAADREGRKDGRSGRSGTAPASLYATGGLAPRQTQRRP